MASLRRHPKSRFWFACFTLADGRQTQRSTKTTERKKAMQIAETYELAARQRMTEHQARKVIEDLYFRIRGERMQGALVKDFFNAWVEGKRVETSPGTWNRYSRICSQFLDAIGDKAAADLNELLSKDILAFRDGMARGLSPATANIAVKVVRMVLKDAMTAGVATANVAAGIRLVAAGQTVERRAFTIAELKRILDVADEEWKGMILFGLYTGQRLGDIRSLAWQNIDLEQKTLSLRTLKTNRRQILPLADSLFAYLAGRSAPKERGTSLFPRAAAATSTGSLSNQFYQILVTAGLARRRTHKATGKGRTARRITNEIGFHALRHTATSLMKNAGMSSAIVQDIIGHDSEAISAHYTHIEEDSKRRAVNSIPDVTQI